MSTLSMKDYIIKNHELDKFKLLYLENAPRLIFYASKYVDSDTAEDLVHDIFIKIWQKKEIYSVEEGLKTYLFRSVQNACLDYLKHKSIEMTYADEVARRLKIEEIDYYNQSDAAELEKERLDSVYREIAKLPDMFSQEGRILELVPRGFYVGLCGREEISGDRRNAKYLSTYGRGATL